MRVRLSGVVGGCGGLWGVVPPVLPPSLPPSLPSSLPPVLPLFTTVESVPVAAAAAAAGETVQIMRDKLSARIRMATIDNFQVIANGP
jgi:hypothetical protein